jgi:hypothetical protein
LCGRRCNKEHSKPLSRPCVRLQYYKYLTLIKNSYWWLTSDTAVLNQRLNGELAPISFYSRLLSSAERHYSAYEKECLTGLFGCERYRSYLEHKQFELQCDNLALCWLHRKVKDVGRLGRWILCLVPFVFGVNHIRGEDNVVAHDWRTANH